MRCLQRPIKIFATESAKERGFSSTSFTNKDQLGFISENILTVKLLQKRENSLCSLSYDFGRWCQKVWVILKGQSLQGSQLAQFRRDVRQLVALKGQSLQGSQLTQFRRDVRQLVVMKGKLLQGGQLTQFR